ncbi:MAG: G5 domain-containing protein [Thermoleophilia bacterium]
MSSLFKNKLVIILIAFLLLALGATLGTFIDRRVLTIDESMGTKINPETTNRFVPEIDDVEVVEEIPFQSINEDDANLPQGQTQVKQEGRNGIRSRVYSVLSWNRKEISRTLIAEVYTIQPSNQIILVGTYVAPPVQYEPAYEAPQDQFSRLVEPREPEGRYGPNGCDKMNLNGPPCY